MIGYYPGRHLPKIQCRTLATRKTIASNSSSVIEYRCSAGDRDREEKATGLSNSPEGDGNNWETTPPIPIDEASECIIKSFATTGRANTLGEIKAFLRALKANPACSVHAKWVFSLVNSDNGAAKVA